MSAVELAYSPEPLLAYGAPPADLASYSGPIVDFFRAAPFQSVLTDDFLRTYQGTQPVWGPLGYVTYKRTYARPLYPSDLGYVERLDQPGVYTDGQTNHSYREGQSVRTEEFWETLARVINGMWHIIRCHSYRKHIDFSEETARKKAERSFKQMWAFKWLPPGRGLWMAGTRFMYTKGSAALNSCAFASTEDIGKEFSEPFTWAMDMSMLGVGIGFDTKGAGKVEIAAPRSTDDVYLIEDSREGWVASVGMVIDAFFQGKELPSFDYSSIRPAGSPIRGFGGVAEGPRFLELCHKNFVTFFTKRIGKTLTESDIVDIFNEIGACVVSGNVRRSAMISLGSPDDKDFISLKHHPDKHPNCWNSNNSVFATVGMDYTEIADLIVSRGEPGVMWLENAQKYSRMDGRIDNKDRRVRGTNPCGEQSLEKYETCCLVETFPAFNHDEHDYQATLKQAYLYGKSVTLVPSHNKRTNKVMGRNSRIGLSMSGIQQARVKFGTREFLAMAGRNYTYLRECDQEYADWLQCRQSIKITSVKPSGSVSLLNGSTPGIHYAIERTYIRRIRFAKDNPMVKVLKRAGYRTYPAPEQPDSTAIVDFPVREAHIDRIEREVSLWEQLEFDAALHELWADNQISITVKFDPLQPGINADIKRALELYETRLKAVSFLPLSALDAGYEAPPYEAISEERYQEEIKHLKPYDFNKAAVIDDILEVACDSGACPIR